MWFQQFTKHWEVACVALGASYQREQNAQMELKSVKDCHAWVSVLPAVCGSFSYPPSHRYAISAMRLLAA